MNYISHHEVARLYDTTASSDFLFGSCASDFARMSDTRRLLKTIANPQLQSGIRFHNLTNKPAFDDQPAIKQVEQGIRTSFDEFLPPRLARQASQASKDLLFDGIQFAKPDVIDALRTTIGQVLSGEVDVTGAEGTPLLKVLERIYEEGPPRYDDIEVVTDRLYLVLSKTRTPLPETCRPAVGEVLAAYQPHIFAIGPTAMMLTVERLRDLLI